MFNPVEFLDLARRLLRLSDGEGKIRTAIGRAFIANKLHLLRRQRNFADYDTKITLSATDAENAIGLAEAVIDEVSSWS